MRHLVVHIGAQRADSGAIHRDIFANIDLLARRGVLVPRTGRNERSPKAIRHTHLAWSLDLAEPHQGDLRIWAELAHEIEQSGAGYVLLSSEVFTSIAADPRTAPLLLDRLRELADDVTIGFVARDQVALLNSLYGLRVRSLEATEGFDEYVERSDDARTYDLTRTFAPWWDAEAVRFTAVPASPGNPHETLGALLGAAGLPVDPEELTPSTSTEDDRVGPIAVAAFRRLGSRLRERFPDFQPAEPAARRLRRRAYVAALPKRWCVDEFWGWSPASARNVEARYAASNQEFARRVWGADWALPADVDRPGNALDLASLDALTDARISRFVDGMERRFERLRQEFGAVG